MNGTVGFLIFTAIIAAFYWFLDNEQGPPDSFA